MNADDAIAFVEELLAGRGIQLNDLERQLFRGVWQGRSYKEIHQEPPACNRNLDHIMRNVGPDLWKKLGSVLEGKVSKSNLRGSVERMRSRQSTHLATGAPLPPSALTTQSRLAPTTGLPVSDVSEPEGTARQDWDMVPDISFVCGRTHEIDLTEQRVRLGYRLLTLFGPPGIGKTTLAARLAHQVRDHFPCRVWRSLAEPVPSQTLIADLVAFLSDRQERSTDISRLIFYLRAQPCLLVLDGFESVLQSGVYNGAYCQGYEGYGELLNHLGRTEHYSCILITSLEKPQEVARMEGENTHVFALKLEGLGELAGREFLAAKGAASRLEGDWRSVIHRYEGNPSALNAIATNVREVFRGDLRNFLEQFQQDTAIFDDIRMLLERQFNRLSKAERAIVHCLALHHEPLTFTEILQSVPQPISRVEVQEVLQSLLRRSLIEVNTARYSLQTLMAEYIANNGRK